MPPKRVKSSTQSGPTAAVGNKAWEAGLVAAPFEEADWTACVSLLAVERLDDEEYVQALLRAVRQPQRRLFRAVSWHDMLEKVSELGNAKAKKPKDAPLFYEVTESAKVILDADEELPPHLLGMLVKFLLLAVKGKDLQRRAAEQKALEDKAKIKTSAPAKDKGGVAMKAPGKSDKGKKTPELPMPQKETKLKRRGQEDETGKFIDDEPDDGPQLYILLVGFYQPQLLSVLDSLGVHASSVIRLNSEALRGPWEAGDVPEGLSSNLPGDEAMEAQNRRRQNEIDTFWANLEAVLNGGPARSKLFDIARLCYTVKDEMVPMDRQNPDAMLALGTRVFEDVACLLYDCLDWRRQHLHYLDNLRLISVPSFARMEPRSTSPENPVEVTVPAPQTSPSKKPIPEELTHATPGPLTPDVPPLPAKVDTRYYCALLESIPPEALSVPLLLHCMLEQVVASQEGIPLPHSTEGLDRSSEEDALNMEKPGEDFRDAGQEQEAMGPLLLNYHDDRSKRLRPLPVQRWINPMRVEAEMLQNTLVLKRICSAKALTDDKLKLARLQELTCFCSDESMSLSEVERAFNQFVFESMPLTKTDQSGCLIKMEAPELGPNPWDDPASFSRCFYEQQIHREGEHGQNQEHLEDRPGVSEADKNVELGQSIQLSEESIRKAHLRSLTDWHFAEHLSAVVLPQVLENASQAYCCVDTFRRHLDNSLFVICHNPVGPQQQTTENWNVALHTDVGFRWYLEYVANSVSDWMQQEEVNWKGIGKQRNAEDLQAQNLTESFISGKVEAQEKITSANRMTNSPKSLDSVVKEPYLREDSLKAWKIEQNRLKEEELNNAAKKDKWRKSSSRVQDHCETSINSKEGPLPTQKRCEDLKSPETVACSRKGGGKRRPAEDEFRGYTGYSMNGSLVRVSGKIESLFPADGGHIRVETVHYVEGSTLVQVAVTKDNHHFVTHIAEPRRNAERNEQTGLSGGGTGTEWKPSASKFGSFTALLDRGVRLSFSHHGTSGESPDDRYPGLIPLPQTPLGTNTPLNLPTGPAPSPSGTCFKSESNAKECPSVSMSGTEVSEGIQQSLKSPDWPPFQTLGVSIPSGLVLQFLCDKSSAAHVKGMLVRQNFPLGGRTPHSLEVSRAINNQGTVVKYMKDGSTQILFADGTVSSSPDSVPVCQSLLVQPALDSEQVQGKPEVKDTLEKRGKPLQGKGTGSELKTEVLAEVVQDSRMADVQPLQQQGGTWVTTTPSGLRVATVNARVVDAQSVLAFKATDPVSGTVVVSREERVLTVLQSDGTVIVEHADGTRITTFYRKAEGEEAHNDNRKEKLVMVECVGFATVVMNCDKRTCSALFGDGTVINASLTGEYQVIPSSGGLLHINEDGSAVYTSPHRNGTILTSGGDYQKLQPGSYVMRHASEVVCEVTDPEGNHFQVMVDGKVYTSVSRPEDHREEELEVEEEEQRNLKGGKISRMVSVGHGEPSARFFIVHADGSGVELLRHQDVEDFLLKAQSDPTVAVLKEAIAEFPGVLGITVLKPCLKDSASCWNVQKQNRDIMPANLRFRKWDMFPSRESRTPDPPFGTSMSRDLSRSEIPSPPLHPPLQSCPEALEVRQLIQYQPISRQLRRELERRLTDYMNHLLRRFHLSKESQVEKLHVVQERVHASKLLHLVPSFSDMADLRDATENRIGSDGDVPDSACLDSHGGKKRESLWQSKLERYRQELREERQLREALRTRLVPPYFHSDIGMVFQLTQEVPDMESLSKALPPFPRTGPNPEIQEFLRNASPNSRSEAVVQGQPDSPTLQDAELSCSGPNPMNGHAPTSKDQMEGPHSPPERKEVRRPKPQVVSLSVTEEGSSPLSLAMDVTVNLRKQRVPLPPGLLSTKPRSLPNHKFLTIEEPVRRKLRTVSMQGLGRVSKVIPRGFELLPAEVEFGVLREGATYCIPVIMRNVGVDSCRFSVKQPPPVTGLRVIYTPGPVAAGMKTQLQVELFATALEQQDPEREAHFSHQIEILTETEILYLPVSATVLSEKLYDNKVQQDTPLVRMGMTKARLVSRTPNVEQGVPQFQRQFPGTAGEQILGPS